MHIVFCCQNMAHFRTVYQYYHHVGWSILFCTFVLDGYGQWFWKSGRGWSVSRLIGSRRHVVVGWKSTRWRICCGWNGWIFRNDRWDMRGKKRGRVEREKVLVTRTERGRDGYGRCRKRNKAKPRTSWHRIGPNWVGVGPPVTVASLSLSHASTFPSWPRLVPFSCPDTDTQPNTHLNQLSVHIHFLYQSLSIVPKNAKHPSRIHISNIQYSSHRICGCETQYRT